MASVYARGQARRGAAGSAARACSTRPLAPRSEVTVGLGALWERGRGRASRRGPGEAGGGGPGPVHSKRTREELRRQGDG